MKSIKFEVTRVYLVFGYYLEYYKSIDGGRGNSGLSELWLGKDDMPFKEFVIQADFSDDSEFGKEYLMQNTFAGAIYNYNEKYQMEEEEAFPVRNHDIDEITYDVTRYYLRDDYYFDVDTLCIYEDDMDSVENITLGKINCLTKASLCVFDTSNGSIAEKEDGVFEEILDTISENVDVLFVEDDEGLMDMDLLAEDEMASEVNIYYRLSAESHNVSDESDDEITFE